MCQPIVMMLVLPFQAELTSTIGPGSRNRRIFDTGKSFFVKALIAPSGSAGGHATRSVLRRSPTRREDLSTALPRLRPPPVSLPKQFQKLSVDRRQGVNDGL